MTRRAIIWTSAALNDLRLRAAAGWSVAALAGYFVVSEPTLRAACQRHGIPLCPIPRPARVPAPPAAKPYDANQRARALARADHQRRREIALARAESHHAPLYRVWPE